MVFLKHIPNMEHILANATEIFRFKDEEAGNPFVPFHIKNWFWDVSIKNRLFKHELLHAMHGSRLALFGDVVQNRCCTFEI